MRTRTSQRQGRICEAIPKPAPYGPRDHERHRTAGPKATTRLATSLRIGVNTGKPAHELLRCAIEAKGRTLGYQSQSRPDVITIEIRPARHRPGSNRITVDGGRSYLGRIGLRRANDWCIAESGDTGAETGPAGGYHPAVMAPRLTSVSVSFFHGVGLMCIPIRVLTCRWLSSTARLRSHKYWGARNAPFFPSGCAI